MANPRKTWICFTETAVSARIVGPPTVLDRTGVNLRQRFTRMTTDLKFAVRMLRQTPGLSGVAILCLALSIGLATAAFSVVHGAFLAPLPVPGGDRLVMVHEYHRSGRFNVPLTAAQFTLRRERNTSFEDIGAWFTRNVTLATEPGGEAGLSLLRAAHVSPNALGLVGIAPFLGRHPVEADVAPGAPPVVLLGHDLWRSRFSGDRQVLDRMVQITGRPHQVIGVMPPGVEFPVRESLWIPVQTDSRAANVIGEPLTLFGKLRSGVSRQEAEAELAVLAAVDERRDPANATSPVVMPFARGFMSPEQEWALFGFLAGLVAFLTVIAGNLANLFLARNAARSLEMALRSALGASRGRLVVQMLAESLVLAATGAIAGLGVAGATQYWFMSQVPDLPWWADFGLDRMVLGFATLAALIATMVAGIGPALRLTKASGGESLKSEAKGSGLRFSRVGAVLLVVQLAVSVGLLSVVGVLAQGLFGFSYERYGIAGEEILVSQVYFGPPAASELSRPGVDRRAVWQRHFETSREQFQRIAARLSEQPGVRQVTYSTHYPGNDVEAVRIELGPGAKGNGGTVTTRIAEIGPDFLETLGAGVLHGRDFSAAERAGPVRSVLVNAPFVRKYFPGQSALGMTLRLLDESDSTPGLWLEIIGVVPDLGLNPGDEERADGMYLPFRPSNFARLAARMETEPAALVPRLHEIVMRENANAQVQSVETLASQMNAAQAFFRGLGAGLLLIGGTALLLSAVSFYSLVSFGVTRRTREIGIRLALGATPSVILKGILRRELTVILSGAVAGVLLGASLYRLVTLVPFDLRPAGPSLLTAAIALIVFVGAGACIVPARRAMSIEPSDALRHE
jgi:putative ABC transport system permease protein